MKSKLRNSVEVEVPFGVGCSTWVQKWWKCIGLSVRNDVFKTGVPADWGCNLKKPQTSHYQKIATCNIFTNSQVRLKHWVFSPLHVVINLELRGFVHQGFYDAQRRKEMKKTRQVMGLQITYVGVAFSVNLEWFSSTNSALFWGWEYKQKHCFFKNILAATNFLRQFWCTCWILVIVKIMSIFYGCARVN